MSFYFLIYLPLPVLFLPLHESEFHLLPLSLIPRRASFNTYIIGVLVKDLFNWRCFYFACSFDGCFLWIWNSRLGSFSFSTLKMTFFYLLVYVVSGERSEIILIVLLYLMCLFCLGDFKYTSVLLFFFSSLIMVHSFLCVYPDWGSLSFLVQWIYIFHRIWKIPAFLQIFLLPSLSFFCCRDFICICVKPFGGEVPFSLSALFSLWASIWVVSNTLSSSLLFFSPLVCNLFY